MARQRVCLEERKEERKRLRERAEASGTRTRDPGPAGKRLPVDDEMIGLGTGRRGKLELIGIDSNPTACQQGKIEPSWASFYVKSREGDLLGVEEDQGDCKKLRSRTNVWFRLQCRKHGMVKWRPAASLRP